MPSPTGAPAAPVADGDAPPLSRTFILIIATEVLTVAALYWLGQHFS
jgi:hypothetical protein